MAAPVYFIDFRASYKENLPAKLSRLVAAAGLAGAIAPRDLTAIKVHFGELGNTTFIRPVLIRPIVAAVQALGAKPFLTDANTLYAGSRGDAVDHLAAALANGFAYPVVGAPLIVADGLRGRSETAVPVDGVRFQEVYIATEIAEADAMVVISHFKGHELAGFGGALKNLGMGCASRRGKLAQHSTVSPRVKRKRCIGCGECVGHCAHAAIRVTSDQIAAIDKDRCVGCGECILVCPCEAVRVKWNQAGPAFLEGMIDYAKGAATGKPEKTLYVTFVTDVTPACDCVPYSDAPIVRNLGVVAGSDPVALDQACVDWVNQEPALGGCCLEQGRGPGEDKFKGLYPTVDWGLQLDCAEAIGLGSRSYERVSV
jgi:uncharacterized Fe-S center protein